MLAWLKNLLGDASTSSLPEGVSQDWLKAASSILSESLDARQAKQHAALHERLLGYVLTGDDAQALQLVGEQSVNRQFWLNHHHQAERKQPLRTALYADPHAVPAPVMLRWLHVLHAIDSVFMAYRGGWFVWPSNTQWLNSLWLHVLGISPNTYAFDPRDTQIGALLDCELMERLLKEAGEPAHSYLLALFSPSPGAYDAQVRALPVTAARGFDDALIRHAQHLRPVLLAANGEQRLHAIALLGCASDAALAEFAASLAQFSTCSNKQARMAAQALLPRLGLSAADPLLAIVKGGKPEQRQHALRNLYGVAVAAGDEQMMETVRTLAMEDKAASVRSLLEEWQSTPDSADAPPADLEVVMPTLDWRSPVTPALKAELQAFVQQAITEVQRRNNDWNRQWERARANNEDWALKRVRPHSDVAPSDKDVQPLLDALQCDGPIPGKPKERRRYLYFWEPQRLQRLASHADMTPAGLLKLLATLGDLQSDQDDSLYVYRSVDALETLYQTHGKPSLLELSLMLDAMQMDGAGSVFDAYMSSYTSPLGQDWADVDVWPFFAHNLDATISMLLTPQRSEYRRDRRRLFAAIATFPQPPEQLVGALFQVALGTGKIERPMAQAALAKLPGKHTRIIAALADGKSEVRAIAAQWLGQLQQADDQTIAALEKALDKEKQDLAKAAMLDALQALGQPLSRYINREQLAKDAAKMMKKPVPAALAWLPMQQLPTVHWVDDGERVPATVLQWMLVQAVKAKSPEPNALMRKYCDMFEPVTRQAFALWLLEAWLAEDVRPISPDEAHQRAQDEAQMWFSILNGPDAQYYPSHPLMGKSEQEMFAALLPAKLRLPVGSAVASKGLLAVVAACAGADVTQPVSHYLKQWYGTRASQGKSLIAMLAWVEHPSATQLMLSIGNRFRTKSFQEEANRQAQALAERRGWTLDALADRTIPTAGLDESGELALSYGERTFSARLTPDFKLALFNAEGAAIKALPEPRKDEDQTLAKDAKKALSSARKEIKTIMQLQAERLYEALCTQRDWSYADWQMYLNTHPLVRHLLQRLVWLADAGDGSVTTFRPMDDGSLTDSDDNAVVLADDARVRIAHDSNLDADSIAAWQQHMADYAVTPLFQQFGKGSFMLPDGRGKATSIDDFKGHLLETFALRGRANKLGYVRGPTEDGGWFATYEKRFPTLNITAMVEFTGNPLPESNRTVALLSLSFFKRIDDALHGQGRAMPLADVPAVLLSECYNDMRLMAAEGTGFDEDWENKSQY